uniref:YjbQ family protein n=1 Tax=Candidatus Enterococcus willemsii TaxID=1857215 RepID=UPI00403F1238
MNIKHGTINVLSNGTRVTYTDITNQVREHINNSGIRDGLCIVSSQHTTCSIIFEEFVHDKDWKGDEFLQVDLNRILDKLVPRQLTETDYVYPGEKHVAFLEEISQHSSDYPNDLTTILNADAHLRASFFGSNQTLIIKDGEPLIGSVGYIYFIDWDQNRQRNRACNLLMMGE